MNENTKLLRLSRTRTAVITADNRYAQQSQVHLEKLLDSVSHMTDRSCFVSGVSASVLRGFEVYDCANTLTFHSATIARGPRKVGGKYGKSAEFTVSYTHYHLPDSAFEEYNGIATLTIPALIIDHLLLSNAFAGIANAEAVLRGAIKPDIRNRSEYERQAKLILQAVEVLLSESKIRAKSRVLRRLKVLSIWSESIGESITKVALLQAGIPLPEQQVTFELDGRAFRIDFVWKALWIAFEFDGLLKYGGVNGREVLIAEKQREDQLRQHFKFFIRLTWREVHDQRTMLSLRKCFPADVLVHPYSL